VPDSEDDAVTAVQARSGTRHSEPVRRRIINIWRTEIGEVQGLVNEEMGEGLFGVLESPQISISKACLSRLLSGIPVKGDIVRGKAELGRRRLNERRKDRSRKRAEGDIKARNLSVWIFLRSMSSYLMDIWPLESFVKDEEEK